MLHSEAILHRKVCKSAIAHCCPKDCYTHNMVLRVVEFSNGGYKIRKVFAENQHSQRKLLNFENWISGEPPKFSKIRVLKINYFYSPIHLINEKGNFGSISMPKMICISDNMI
jgi:hypothetical protein